MNSFFSRSSSLRSLGRRFPRWLQAPLKQVATGIEKVLSSGSAVTSARVSPKSVPANLIESPRSGPYISHPEYIFGVEHTRSIHPTSRLFVRERVDGTFGKLILGPGTYLGTEVELAALGKISIGKDTSIQNYCTIHGDVMIGAHCLFGPFVLVGSTTHRFRDRPFWHIRDQDELIHQQPELALEPVSDPIVIEDDCWIGSSVAVMPGVYIGRGSVIGVNCVVTSDIGPFEIHGGIPNRKIGNRLEFVPPTAISATNDFDLPYFYRGFRTSQSSLFRSRKKDMIEVDDNASFVLAAHPNAKIALDIVRLDCDNDVFVRIRINGVDCGIRQIVSGKIELGMDSAVGLTNASVPRCLAKYTYVEIIDVLEANGRADAIKPCRYGIKAALLLSDG